MWHPFLLLGLVPAFASIIHATALTYKLAGNEKACFFAEIQPDQVNAKIAFYFAVRFLTPTAVHPFHPVTHLPTKPSTSQ